MGYGSRSRCRQVISNSRRPGVLGHRYVESMTKLARRPPITPSMRASFWPARSAPPGPSRSSLRRTVSGRTGRPFCACPNRGVRPTLCPRWKQGGTDSPWFACSSGSRLSARDAFICSGRPGVWTRWIWAGAAHVHRSSTVNH
jgi:hypothetical protein